MVVQRRETLVNWNTFWVMTDITGQWTAAFTGNQIVSLLGSRCGFIVAVHSAWRKHDFVGQLIFLSHSLRNVSSRSRRSRPLFPPLALLPCCAGFSREMPARCRLSPYPFFILASSCPSVHLSICARNGSSLWLGKCVQSSSKSVTLAVISCVAGLYFVSSEAYCQGWSVGRLKDSYYPAGSFYFRL